MEKKVENSKKWKYGGAAVFAFFLIKGLVWLAIFFGMGKWLCN